MFKLLRRIVCVDASSYISFGRWSRRNHVFLAPSVLPPPLFPNLVSSWLTKLKTKVQQQQQLKKLGILYLLPRPVQPIKESLYAKGQSQTVSQSEQLEKATLFPGLSPGYIWLISLITVVLQTTIEINVRICDSFFDLRSSLFRPYPIRGDCSQSASFSSHPYG